MTYKKQVKIIGFIDFEDGSGGALTNRTPRIRRITKSFKYIRPYNLQELYKIGWEYIRRITNEGEI